MKDESDDGLGMVSTATKRNITAGAIASYGVDLLLGKVGAEWVMAGTLFLVAGLLAFLITVVWVDNR